MIYTFDLGHQNTGVKTVLSFQLGGGEHPEELT